MELTNNVVQMYGKHYKGIKQIMLYGALVVFIASLAIYAVGQFFPDNGLPSRFIPTSLLGTITAPLSFLLIYELFALTIATTGPFATFVLRLFEIVSLIVLRDLFKRLDELSRGFSSGLLLEVTVVAFGSLLLYFLIEVLERLSRHIIGNDLKRELPNNKLKHLQVFKDMLEIGLVLFFAGLVLYEVVGWLLGVPGTGLSSSFVHIMFSGLIIYSIFLLLIVLLITSNYETLFEHSSLILAIIVVLIALDAPTLIMIPMILGAMIFVICTLLLHGFARGRGGKGGTKDLAT